MPLRLLITSLITLITTFSITVLAHAHSYQTGQLYIGHPYARTTVPGQPAGAAYLSVENKGSESDKLIAATSPIARSVEIHSMTMEGNVMKMRASSAIELAPGSKIAMQPGAGYHLMLLGLQQPLKAGERFPLSLRFEKAGQIDVSVAVENLAPKTEQPTHQH